MASVIILRDISNRLLLSSRQSLVFFSSSASEGRPALKTKQLFKVARWTNKRTNSYEPGKIDEKRAMAEFDLSEEHLRDLPKEAHIMVDREHKLYSVSDVYSRAVKVHGSQKAVYDKARTTLGSNKLSESEKMMLRLRAETEADKGASTTKGADFVVGIAFCLNACDMICKFGAAYLTGSKSLAAEGIHSAMDTVNQLILLFGIKYSKKNPDPNFPYGYGNSRYVASLISGCGIAAFGCGLSLHHGISGLLNPTPLEPLTYAYYALFMSLCFQGASAMTAIREVRRKAANAKMPVLSYVKTHADPSLNVVLLEDSAAVTGVLVALTAVSLSSLLNSPIPDSVGSIVIGCLLGTVAGFIIRSNASHLVGRSLPQRMVDDITCRLRNDSVIRSVHDVKATSLGVEQSRFKAELDFDGREITRRYLKEKVDMPAMLQQVHNIKTTGQLEQFMIGHGEQVIDRIGDEIDRLESEIVKKHPDIKYVDLEAL